jgi:hypothetical protein
MVLVSLDHGPMHTHTHRYRVLKPGAAFVFWEHVLSEDNAELAALQERERARVNDYSVLSSTGLP